MSGMLTDVQQEKLEMFKEITQIHDDGLAIDILSENRWNVDTAVERHVHQPTSVPRSQTVVSSSSSTPANQQTRAPANNGRRSNSIFDFILLPLRWLFQSRPLSLNPDSDTRKFISEFDLNFSSIHPVLHDRSYQSAVLNAFQTSKYLLVYLHSPMHEDTPRFCNQSFCSQEFSQFANQHMVTWVGRVWDPEAFALSTQLKATTFPFLALLICQSDKMVQVVDRVQGFMVQQDLQERLQNCMAVHNVALTRIRTDVERRAEFGSLRVQQDREYEESVRQEREAQERREAEQQAQAQREEQDTARQELEAAIALSTQLSHCSKMEQMKAQVGDEPAVGADVAVIRFQLPQGAKIARRFARTDSVEKIYNFLLVHLHEAGSTVKNISVCTQFPKISLDNMALTIDDKSLGLFPRGMLYVQDLDA